jgi:predicted amidophosphoribosyltransferase
MNKEELIDVTNDIVDELVPMPPNAPDVCPICRSGRKLDFATCWSCKHVRSQITYPCPIVIPVSFYRTPSPLRERMHDYKESEDPSVRLVQSRVVGGILARYFEENSERLARSFTEWDAVVPVPSTKNPPPSALTRALNEDYSDFVIPSEWLSRGTGSMSHNKASESGFEVTSDVSEARVLLIDDTFTTGARMNSAAHTLRAAGATVVAGLVVARKINPPQMNTGDLWERQSAIPFNFTDVPWWAS